MEKHVKNYFDFFEIDFDLVSGWHDFIPCEMCGRPGVDLHHIENRIKGVERLNGVNNIICLCRECHEKAHGNVYGYDKACLKQRHENNMNLAKHPVK